MTIIDGRKLRDEILETIKKEVKPLNFQPVFCDVLVGEDPVSVQYVEMKARTAEAVGIKFHRANFPASITTSELTEEIKKLNAIPNMCGLIVQLPLPEHIEKEEVLNAIDPKFDVDCLGEAASERFYQGDTSIGFPTAQSCMALLEFLDLDLKNKKIVVLGQGMLVGKPVAALLCFQGFTPVIVTKETLDKEVIIKSADIIISGIGKGKHITGEMIKPGAVLIDAGTSEDSKCPAKGRAGIVGDVDFESVKNIASYVSPVPGGVGPVTVAMLLRNVLAVAKKMIK